MSIGDFEECEVSLLVAGSISGVYRFYLVKDDATEATVTREFFHLHDIEITETTGTTELPLLDRLP